MLKTVLFVLVLFLSIACNSSDSGVERVEDVRVYQSNLDGNASPTSVNTITIRYAGADATVQYRGQGEFFFKRNDLRSDHNIYLGAQTWSKDVEVGVNETASIITPVITSYIININFHQLYIQIATVGGNEYCVVMVPAEKSYEPGSVTGITASCVSRQ